MNYQAGTTASYAPFSVTIFISSFLLFLVQPIVGKFLLPHFGGSTSVWAVSLVFFTGVLFLGYTYVFLLSRFPVRTQAIIHSSLVAITIVASALSIMMRGTFFPSLDWTLDSSLPTALQVILALIQTIGLPYFVLSTSSPLIQQWFNAHHSKEPYKLYVISNIASFLALGVYPFLVEPAFTLFHQGQIWALLVIVCFSLHAFLAWKTLAI